MPCYDSGPSQREIEFEKSVRRGAVVGLCRACAILEAADQLPDELKAWYAAHRASDDNRKWLAVAEQELHEAKKAAKARGYDLSSDHVARVRTNECYQQLRKSESLEMIEQAKLATLSE